MTQWDNLTDAERYPIQERAAELLRGLYFCRRAWTAWRVGTMSEGDFGAADEDAEVVDNLAEGLYAAASAERDSLRARAEAAEQRAEAAERKLAQARAVVESQLAEVSQYDYTMRTLWGSHSKDREVEIRTLQKVLHDINALGGAA